MRDEEMAQDELDKRFFDEVDKRMLEVKSKLIKKRRDYGRDNILRHREYGVLVRKDDKMSRVANLLKPGVKPLVEDESIQDTVIDDIGYDLILLALLGNKW